MQESWGVSEETTELEIDIDTLEKLLSILKRLIFFKYPSSEHFWVTTLTSSAQNKSDKNEFRNLEMTRRIFA